MRRFAAAFAVMAAVSPVTHLLFIFAILVMTSHAFAAYGSRLGSKAGVFALFLLASMAALPVASYADAKCDRLEKEAEAEKNLIARERAAIEDLHNPKLEELHRRLLAGWTSVETYEKESSNWSQGLRCIKAEAELKYYQAGLVAAKKKIDAKCWLPPIPKHLIEQVKYRTDVKAEECSEADLEYLSGMVRQLAEVKAAKLANEEPKTFPVKLADRSKTSSEFCVGLRAAVAEAPTFFKTITGQQKQKYFVEPGTLGSKGVSIGEMVKADFFATTIQLSQDFMAQPAECEISISTNPELALRVPPMYACDWRYLKTTRKELEERTDRLLNIARGCFAQVTEIGTEDSLESHRHHFIVEDRAKIAGSLHYGEGKPSYIKLDVMKNTPKEDQACARYGGGKSLSDRELKELCLKRYP